MQRCCVLITLKQSRSAIHVPFLLCLISGAVGVFAFFSNDAEILARPLIARFFSSIFLIFAIAQFRHFQVRDGEVIFRSLLRRRTLPVAQTTFGIEKSRSHHGLPLYLLVAVAGEEDLLLSDFLRKRAAEQKRALLRSWLEQP